MVLQLLQQHQLQKIQAEEGSLCNTAAGKHRQRRRRRLICKHKGSCSLQELPRRDYVHQQRDTQCDALSVQQPHTPRRPRRVVQNVSVQRAFADTHQRAHTRIQQADAPPPLRRNDMRNVVTHKRKDSRKRESGDKEREGGNHRARLYGGGKHRRRHAPFGKLLR